MPRVPVLPHLIQVVELALQRAHLMLHRLPLRLHDTAQAINQLSTATTDSLVPLLLLPSL